MYRENFLDVVKAESEQDAISNMSEQYYNNSYTSPNVAMNLGMIYYGNPIYNSNTIGLYNMTENSDTNISVGVNGNINFVTQPVPPFNYNMQINNSFTTIPNGLFLDIICIGNNPPYCITANQNGLNFNGDVNTNSLNATYLQTGSMTTNQNTQIYDMYANTMNINGTANVTDGNGNRGMLWVTNQINCNCNM